MALPAGEEQQLVLKIEVEETEVQYKHKDTIICKVEPIEVPIINSEINEEILLQEDTKERRKSGEFWTLYEEYRKHPKKFYEYTGLSIHTFDYILENAEEHLYLTSNINRVVTASEKLFLTLRYLASGSSFSSLSQSFRLGRSTVSKTIYGTLKAIWKSFNRTYIPQPTQDIFEIISEDFLNRWNFPNCVGAIERKQFQVAKPPDGCSKKHYAIVLHAVSDADSNFTVIEVGIKEDQDDEPFLTSKLHKLLEDNQFNLPPPKPLPGSNVLLPHVLVGDESYPLKKYLMRPYPPVNLEPDKEIFNKRMTSARLPIRCALSILINRFQVFKKPVEINIQHAKLLIKVACLLHNIVRQKEPRNDREFKDFMTETSQKKNKIKRSKRNNRSSHRAVKIREQYTEYFANHS